MAGIDRFANAKERHKAQLFGMYVDARARSGGVGRALLAAAVTHALDWPGIERITLTVTDGNDGAVRLYERAGFRRYAVEPRAIKIDARYYDKLHMALEREDALARVR